MPFSASRSGQVVTVSYVNGPVRFEVQEAAGQVRRFSGQLGKLVEEAEADMRDGRAEPLSPDLPE
jgi:hypothetical protein